MKDALLLRVLMDQFQEHPLLASAKLGISVEDGVVILSGYVADSSLKAVAELIALGSHGVKALANEIETVTDETWRYVDCQIARKTFDLLDWNGLSPENLRIKVERGRLSLFGVVDSLHKHQAISLVVEQFSGAKAIDNHIKVVLADEMVELVCL